jgi:hypothetical protein
MTLLLPARADDYPAYSFTVDLDGDLYQIGLRWNERDSAWYMSLADNAGEAIATGLRVVTGWDMLRRITDARRPPGAIIAIDTTGTGEITLENLGNSVLLVYESDVAS